MIRYTTPTLVFNVPLDTSILEEVYVTLKQGKTILEKKYNQCLYNGKQITVCLSQAETAEFKPNREIYIQLRCKDENGNAYASQIFRTEMESVIKEGVI